MSVHKVVTLDADGNQLDVDQAGGTCTGFFGGRSNGSYGNHKNCDGLNITLGINGEFDLRSGKKYVEDVINSAFIQGLTPGTQLVGWENEDSRVTIGFRGINDMPCDRVITALRTLNCITHGSYQTMCRGLREYELTADEMVVLSMFAGWHPKASDHKLSLWGIERGSIAIPETVNRGNENELYHPQKKQPDASMLVPLIRGEIAVGWQNPISKGGYHKEDYLVYPLMSKGKYNPYNVGDDWTLCPDDGHLTVNSPIIHRSTDPEAPKIPSGDGGYNYRNDPIPQHTAAVTEYVLKALGK